MAAFKLDVGVCMSVIGRLIVASIMILGVVSCGGNRKNDIPPAPIFNIDLDSGNTESAMLSASDESEDSEDNVAAKSGGNVPAMLQDSVSALPKKVHFAFDRFTLRSQDKHKLQQNADFLVKYPKVKVLIAGHTDPRGSQGYNLNLGKKRANATKSYLLAQGVPVEQICTVSYGDLRPEVRVSNTKHGHWKKAYALDRRAVLNYQSGCHK